jgi:hypothetical protein
MIVRWVLALAPADFGLARSELVWRRPRPVVRRHDPERSAKLAALRELLHELPADETAVFMDEVEVHTNPKVGSMWVRRGQQAIVGTPEDSEKWVLAGSLHWRTGRLIETWGGAGEGRTAGRFCRHLDNLRRAFRRYRVIHVICDNAFNHRPDRSKVVRAYLARWGRRVRLHFLPKYAPTPIRWRRCGGASTRP